MTKATHNGTCQACGRKQAVKANGLLAQHGYTVDYGYFNGTCSGSDYRPLEQDTAHNKRVVNSIRDWAKEQDMLADGNIETAPVQVKDTESNKSWAQKTIQINRADYVASRTRDDSSKDFSDLYNREFDKKIETVRLSLRRNAEFARKDASALETLRAKTFGNELTSREVPADQRPQKETGFRTIREGYERADELKKLGFVSVRVNGGTMRVSEISVTYRQA